MRPFDITMTATLRPELIKITLDSHIENLFGDEIKKARLIVNVDMAGATENKDEVLHEVLGVLFSYPFRDVSLRVGTQPHFPTAFFWCWDQATAEYVFHLEEDWQMVQPLRIDDMQALMDDDRGLVHLRLSQFKSGELHCKNWNKFTHWNGDYFFVHSQDKGIIGWAGHPSLNRLSFMRNVLQYADRSANPEKQIKGRKYQHPINDFFEQSRFGVFTPQNCEPVVVDIGRQWMVDHGWAKAGNKAFFTNWQKVRSN